MEVEINNSDNTYIVKKSIALQGIAPKMIVYENSPLFGIMYENALKGAKELAGKEIKLLAVPFFLSGDIRDPDISYTWKMNGAPLSGESSDALTLRAPEEGSVGNSNIIVTVRKSSKIFQAADGVFTLSFKQTDE